MPHSLSELITSLTGPEKAYFRKRALAFAGAEAPAYLQLFDALQERPVPVETVLRKRFAQGRSASYYATLRGYLYRQLLDSLAEYRSGKSKRDEAEQRYRHAQVLIERKMYDTGLKELRKANKLAARLEFYTLQIECLRLESNTIGLYRMSDGAVRKREINAAMKQLLEWLEQERFYFALYDRLYTLSRRVQSLQPETAATLEEELQHPLLRNPARAHSLTARQLYNGIFYTYHTLRGESGAAYQYSRANLDLWEAHPFLRSERFKEFMASYLNHINRCYQLGRAIELRNLLDGMEALDPPRASYEALLAVRRWLYELHYLEMTAAADNFAEVARQAEHTLETYGSSVPLSERRLLLYNLAYQAFRIRKYDRALDYCVEFDALPRATGQTYLQRAARLLALLIHFELGNYPFLENTLPTHQNQLRRSGEWGPFERLFLRMLADFTKQAVLYRPDFDYAGYRKAFASLRKDSYAGRTLDYLDVVAWLRGREGIT